MTKKDHGITLQQSKESWDLTLMRWLARVGEHYRLELSDLNVDVWREECADLNTAQLDAGFRRLIRTVEAKPNVAKLRRMIRELQFSESTDYIKKHVDTPEEIELERQRLDRQRQFEREIAEGVTTLKPEKPTPLPPDPVRRGYRSIKKQKEELRKRGFIA